MCATAILWTQKVVVLIGGHCWDGEEQVFIKKLRKLISSVAINLYFHVKWTHFNEIKTFGRFKEIFEVKIRQIYRKYKANLAKMVVVDRILLHLGPYLDSRWS